MSNFIARLFCLATLCLLCFQNPGFCVHIDPSVQEWDNLIELGHNQMSGNTRAAIGTFGKAVELAKDKHLATRYYAEALCRQTTAEVASDDFPIQVADKHCKEVRYIHKSEKAEHTLEPDLEGYMLELADKYMLHKKSDIQDCLEHAFKIRGHVLK